MLDNGLVWGVAATGKSGIESLFEAAGRKFEALHAWAAASGAELWMFAFGAAVSIVAAFVVYRIFLFLAGASVKRMRPAADVFRQMGAPVAIGVLLTGLAFSNSLINFPGNLDMWLDKLFLVLFIFAAEWCVLRFITVFDNYFSSRRRDRRSGKNQLVSDLLRRTAKTLVWVLTIIFLMQNVFGYNVSALLAGAGVAGLALAFAAQNTISNFFGAISLAYDDVFKVGERLLIDGEGGVVESMGLRSMTLRSLDGSVWSIPNHLVADSKVENISRRRNIKHSFKLGLVYSTTPDEMQQALDILKSIFDGFPGFDLKDAPPLYFFTDFSAFSLDISVVVWFNTLDFAQAQQWKEQMNMEILRRFNAAKLQFAYPTSTNYVVKGA